MSEATPDASDTEKKKRSANEDEVPDSEAENEQDGDEAEEEEYEIEAILKHQVRKGKMSYFVKWKGYDNPKDNTWVDEEDAGNAAELIEVYQKSLKAKKAKETPSASAKRAPRKSSALSDNNSDLGETVSAPPKKRGRKSNAAKSMEPEDEDRPAKKARRSTKNNEPLELPADEELANMDEYRDTPAWDHLIKQVDTVERANNNVLYVYFTLLTGQRVREDSKVCGEKFPKLLIDFYETNLRWRETDDTRA
ncbi:hypothetical protein C8F01DRAFT_742490 [Mycena amicta]|nr:hypothetical protein C8F01DRAFT_742490 [Mycena amicta]